MSQSDLSKLRNIKCIILDVDGVLTDGTVQVTEAGDMLRTFNIKDGYAIQHAVKQGYQLVVISGGSSNGVKVRMEKLGVKEVYLAISNKLDCFGEITAKLDLEKDACLYVGDEMIDIPVMKEVGLAVCPSDAASQVKEISAIITHQAGGKGCVREIIEKVMTVQGTWDNSESHVW
jgi:3-deoxy-D-manno-octulosonate 8-phosphate phosphatase (KDO 8-P phosphatase)